MTRIRRVLLSTLAFALAACASTEQSAKDEGAPSDPGSRMYPRVYEVRDLTVGRDAPGDHQLASVIRTVRERTTPGTWDAPGTSLKPSSGQLVAVASEDTHRELESILNQLREERKQAQKERREIPTRVVVQHVLIAFQRAPGFRGRPVPPGAVRRSQEQAKKLAEEILESARSGADFSGLVREHSDDRVKPNDVLPGVYVLVSDDRQPAEGEFKRGRMVEGFGDTAFALEVGDVGLCVFEAAVSPFGWHVIKRVE